MPFRNSIDVIREEEKLLYRIMKEIERDGESIVSSNNPEWRSVNSKINYKLKTLQEENILYPVLKPCQHNRKSDIRVIKKYPNIHVREVLRGKKSIFPFEKPKR